MYKNDLALNDQQGLKCHNKQTKPTNRYNKAAASQDLLH